MIEQFTEDKATRLLSSFSCSEDFDIEDFLHNKAIEFEKLSKARTYLVFNQEQLKRKQSPLIICGYITIALKVLSVPSNLSNRKRKEIDGFSAKHHGKQIDDFPCYLIGQLARNSDVSSDIISGKELIDFACDIIASAAESVGGRYIMIECRDEEKLIRFYENNFFSEISRISDQNKPMVQMIRKI